MTGPGRTVQLFLQAAATAGELIGAEATADRWEQPSLLAGYTVGGLAGHLARGVLRVEVYLDRPAPPAEAITTDAAGYFAAALGDDDPVDSAAHRQVRERARQTAADGPGALAAEVGAARRRLTERVRRVDTDRPVTVHGELCLPLVEYLRTRLVELVVHGDDLASSLDRPVPDSLPEAAYRPVAEVLAGLAVHRMGGLSVVRGLARRERHPEAVRAL